MNRKYTNAYVFDCYQSFWYIQEKDWGYLGDVTDEKKAL